MKSTYGRNRILVMALLSLLVSSAVLLPVWSNNTSNSAAAEYDLPDNWQEYGAEAFHQALSENKPLLLVITAKRCWTCRVYIDEVVKDEYVTSVIKTYYIPMYVDADERPDLYREYGARSLPHTVFFSVYGEPLRTLKGYVGPDTLFDRLSFHMDYVFNDIEFPANTGGSTSHYIPNKLDFHHLLTHMLSVIENQPDTLLGLFPSELKEPQARTMKYLMWRYSESGNTTWLDAVETVLVEIAPRLPYSTGNITGFFDPVEGGFFEGVNGSGHSIELAKTLERNADYIDLFVSAYNVTGNATYKDIALRSIDYVLNTLYDDNVGAFYASQMDSGSYYFLSLKERLATTPPEVDTQIYAAGNAIMARALLNAGDILENASLVDVALKTLETIGSKLVTDRGCLNSFNSETGLASDLDGLLSDNLWTAWAFLEAYSATNDESYLLTARVTLDFAAESLYDNQRGGFILRNSTKGQLFRAGERVFNQRQYPENSLATRVYLRAEELTGDLYYHRKAIEALGAFVIHDAAELLLMPHDYKVYFVESMEYLTVRDNPHVFYDMSVEKTGVWDVFFKVSCQDLEGQHPGLVSVVIDGVAHPMTLVSGTPGNGMNFEAKITLSGGTQTYTFETTKDRWTEQRSITTPVKIDNTPTIIFAILAMVVALILLVTFYSHKSGLLARKKEEESKQKNEKITLSKPAKAELRRILREHPDWGWRRVAKELDTKTKFRGQIDHEDVRKMVVARGASGRKEK